MPTAINVLAVDHSPIYLHGLLACFTQLPIVAKADICLGYDQVFEKIWQLQPHIIFLELNQSNYRYDSFSLCRDISSRHKNILLAVISRCNSEAYIKEAQNNGAHAFFDKHVAAETLESFLYNFSAETKGSFHVQLSNQRINPNARSNDFLEMYNQLTKREREVMRLITEGLGHRQIESLLSVTYDTYKSHRSNILRKLHLKNDVELTRLVLNQTVHSEPERLAGYR
jgi:DNA-binding NarL/FixJ family response regulator